MLTAVYVGRLMCMHVPLQVILAAEVLAADWAGIPFLLL